MYEGVGVMFNFFFINPLHCNIRLIHCLVFNGMHSVMKFFLPYIEQIIFIVHTMLSTVMNDKLID